MAPQTCGGFADILVLSLKRFLGIETLCMTTWLFAIKEVLSGNIIFYIDASGKFCDAVHWPFASEMAQLRLRYTTRRIPRSQDRAKGHRCRVIPLSKCAKKGSIME
jgi:hypothetical protein